MKARVIIVHGYGGYPEKNWFPWLKERLEKQRVKVVIPAMPNTDAPQLKEWLPYLQKVAGKIDKNTFFVGHSLGCPTILRYLESLNADKKVGGVILVSTFAEPLSLTELNSFTEPSWDDKRIMQATDNIILINSDNDPYIPFIVAERTRDRFKAKLIKMHNAGHINEKFGFTSLPVVFDELQKLIKS